MARTDDEIIEEAAEGRSIRDIARSAGMTEAAVRVIIDRQARP